MTSFGLTWLGQAGFLIETERSRILIDPWVSPSEGRLIEPPPPELVSERISSVLVTHEHLDHLDVAFLRQLGAKLVLPQPIADQAPAGLTVTEVRPGDRIEVDDVVVEVVPAWHGVETTDAYVDGDGRFVGYLIEIGGSVVYHAGDTIVTEGLISALEGKKIDIALLPVNGRDFFRESAGIVGNLDAREAVALARLLGAHTLVPYHWDAYAGNTERPGRVIDEALTVPGLHVLFLGRFVRFRLGG